jgi:hypothetical protein
MPVTKVRAGSSGAPSHSPAAKGTSLPPPSSALCSSTTGSVRTSLPLSLA